MFIYPDNLKAKATLWLWQLRDVAIIGVAFLLSVLALAQTGTMLPLGTVLYAPLAIQVGGLQRPGLPAAGGLLLSVPAAIP